MVNLDTHVLIHALAGSLTSREKRTLSMHEWGISAIVLWELAKLVQLRRLSLDLDAASTKQALAAIHVFPITLEVARASTGLDFSSDPADELIAATSIVYRVELLTRDKRILKSKQVPLVKGA